MCVHHWEIDQRDVGTCLKCGKVRDFGSMIKDYYNDRYFVALGFKRSRKKIKTRKSYAKKNR